MILDDGNATRIELHILGYQFPELTTHDHDSNWLIVELRFDSPTESWVRSGPFALTDEMERLAIWLRRLAEGALEPDIVDFMEPELAFRAERDAAGRRTLFAGLGFSFRPGCSPGDEEYFQTLELSFTPTDAELLAAAAAVEAEVRRFPPRLGPGSREPFAPPEFLPTFVVHWLFLSTAWSQADASASVEEFMHTARLPVEILSCDAAPRAAPGWAVRATTTLPTPSSSYGEALYIFMSRAAVRYRFPELLAGAPLLDVDGSFTCRFTSPARGARGQRGQDLGLRWWCILTNHDAPYAHGTLPVEAFGPLWSRDADHTSGGQ